MKALARLHGLVWTIAARTSMVESFEDYSWIQDFEADFP